MVLAAGVSGSIPVSVWFGSENQAVRTSLKVRTECLLAENWSCDIDYNRNLKLAGSCHFLAAVAGILKKLPYLCVALPKMAHIENDFTSYFSGLVVAAPKHRIGLPVRLVKSTLILL